MKVGILTFHNAHNYGAVLQAYALKKKLNSFSNVEAEIIDYQNKCIKEKYSLDINSKISYKNLISPKRIKHTIEELINRKAKKESWENQHREFEKFINSYLISDNRFNINNVLKRYDTLIVGSDQVWEKTITGGYDPIYWLDFKFNGIKASYAASLGNYNLTPDDKLFFKKKLNNYQLISVREDNLKKYILSFYNQDEKEIMEDMNNSIEVTLDPTLLLNREDYYDIFDRNNKEKEKYLFAYYVVEDKKMQNYTMRLSKEYNLKIVELHYYGKKKYNENQHADFSPSKFLSYIYNAELVVTNSFHGTAMSIMFEKKFICNYEKNDRIENLLKNLSLEKHHVNVHAKDAMIKIERIDYCDVKKRLEKYRQDSIDYLKRIILRSENDR